MSTSRLEVWRYLLMCVILALEGLRCAAQDASNCCSAQALMQSGQQAQAFCSKPATKLQQCGWASDSELKATSSNPCPYASLSCGSTTVPKTLPATLDRRTAKDPISYRKVISLACKGSVVVRTVFKLVTQKLYNGGRQQCADARLAPNISTDGQVVRCELQLPTGSGSEADRALRANETNCYLCYSCNQSPTSGCPVKLGAWYSDSFTATVPGCGFDASRGYEVLPVDWLMQPGSQVILAKFEVCNSPGCYNQATETAKYKSAKVCNRGECT